MRPIVDHDQKGNEIKDIFENALHRDLSEEEDHLITNWVQGFNREERATIINMMKELINQHKRHD
ncbi:hypothetical protein LCM10_05505 [Rossellomorea aquimaris]|uniref:hypothetical protein n=1 Tax=Rossellomorea aquimaris TaxID=189382 RepID=UPI001CD1C78D|nr:hypothetical protein [Rossellomorea aquimaris]MCA1054434.1 hypothetical protein [Rossellomorea aquimaris]